VGEKKSGLLTANEQEGGFTLAVNERGGEKIMITTGDGRS